MLDAISLQDKYSPEGICFGCGPKNLKGIMLKSFVEADAVIARFSPQPHHQAFPNVLCGGIVGTLLDCHCNWAGAWALMQHNQSEAPPCTVTAEYTIKLLRPTPTQNIIRLRAAAIEVSGSRVSVEGELYAEDKLCATCHGVFVAVKPGHPAYHRW